MPVNINTNQLVKLYNERILWMLKEKNFGRRCRFHYPPKVIRCSNCHQGAGGLSLGTYKIGGPEPFEGVCPVCLGKGTFEETKTEEDILIVLFDSQQWFSPGKVTKLPDNTAMVIGDRRRTWNKVLQCDRIILDLNVNGDNAPYKKIGEMYAVGLFNGDDKSGSRFFYAYVCRDGGG